MKTVRVGSRDSLLAVAQAEMVIARIKRFDPEIQTELVTMKTTGDIILDKPLYEVGGKGLFVKELDEALRSGRADITVHSYKDMPMEDDPELPVVAVSKREDPRDALILPADASPDEEIKVIGCSSKRRIAQVLEIFPNARIESLRGNVSTRLSKLDRRLYSAAILAGAGLIRLGLSHRASRFFSPEEMIPSACQGIIAVQARAGEDAGFLELFDDADSRDAAAAERGFVRALEGGCTSPVAVFAEIHGREIHIRGLYIDEDTGAMYRGTVSGSRDDARKLGERLALELKTGR
ncbi:porphobilinogen deaminase [Clostridia bacterium]|nr:porphobilinogen deaminase [Clostridia bacterium]